jgi:plasmid stability protein
MMSPPPPSQDPKDTETSRMMIVRLPAATHRALRIRVAENDTTIQDWVKSLLERELGLTTSEPRAAGGRTGRR